MKKQLREQKIRAVEWQDNINCQNILQRYPQLEKSAQIEDVNSIIIQKWQCLFFAGPILCLIMKELGLSDVPTCTNSERKWLVKIDTRGCKSLCKSWSIERSLVLNRNNFQNFIEKLLTLRGLRVLQNHSKTLLTDGFQTTFKIAKTWLELILVNINWNQVLYY